MALAMVKKDNFLFTRMKVLGTNNGDSPRSWASVIRPAYHQETYGQLYLTDQQMLVGVRSGNKCYLAYDVSSGKFYGHGEIETVSPFISLGKNDALDLDDIDTIRKRIKEQEPGTAGHPRTDSLKIGRMHPNPIVKEVAENLLTLVSERKQRPESK